MQLRFKVAGLSDMGLIRTNNEDNFQISRDLSVEPMRWVNNEACLLTNYGTLLVVADGMGGMNAGEVASQIAIETIKEVFSPAALAGINLGSVADVNAHIAAAVTEADSRIKATAAQRPETHGMGTTIVIAWLLNGKLHVGWCGDSRAYIFNPATGLRRLSKDHSYVQTLVDAGKLTEEQAFDYPQSNIITRCLSDSNAIAEADVLPVPVTVADGDIILLCTDGLCGMIRDNMIESILVNSPASDLTVTARGLVDGALAAGGADNVTVALLQVVSGGAKASQRVLPQAFGEEPATQPAAQSSTAKKLFPKGFSPKNWMFIALAGVIAGTVLAFLAFTFWGGKDEDNTARTDIDLISGRDSILKAQNNNQENGPSQSSTAQNGGTTSASQLSNLLASGISNFSIGANSKEDASAGASSGATPADDDNTDSSTDGQQSQPDNGSSSPAINHNKDSIAKPGAPVPPPTKRKVIKIRVTKNIRTILRDHKMKQTDFNKLNPGVESVKINDSIFVYEVPN